MKKFLLSILIIIFLITGCSHKKNNNTNDLIEDKKYYDAYQEIINNEKSDIALNELCTKIYDDAVELYHNKNISSSLGIIITSDINYEKNAHTYFSFLKENCDAHKRTNDYLTLIYAINEIENENYTASQLENLKELIPFENSVELLESNQYLPKFLIGQWSGDGYSMIIDDSNIKYTIPHNNYNETVSYEIYDQKLIIIDGNNKYIELKFEIIDKNTISVLSTKTNKTYTLIRL